MGNLLKKCFKLFFVCMMCISVVACGARNKDYSEISQILKDEYSANGRPLVTVEKSTQYAKQVHLTKKLNTVGSPF